MDFWCFVQFEFHKQWNKLHKYVNSLGIKIIGDMPIYVAYDSADVWANPGMFWLDENLNPVKVAGCPPDGFSPDGQLWGNPIYDWKKNKATNCLLYLYISNAEKQYICSSAYKEVETENLISIISFISFSLI